MQRLFLYCSSFPGSMKKILRAALILMVSVLLVLPAESQDHHQRYQAIDVLFYHFEIDLNDSSDVIRGNAHIEIAFKEDVDRFQLDLAYSQEQGTGMKVTRLTEDGKELEILQRDDKITLSIAPALQAVLEYIKRFPKNIEPVNTNNSI